MSAHPPAAQPADQVAMSEWSAPTASAPVHATVTVPGSKSITNRAYVLAALAQDTTTVRRPLTSRDTRLMADALHTMGADVRTVDDGLRVQRLGAPTGADVSVDLGNAGTVARFTPALAALGNADVHFDGDAAIRRRPVGPLLAALRTLGAGIDDGGSGGFPLSVSGRGGLPGGTVELDASASSQFLSALLLVAPATDHGVTVTLTSEVPSEPHIAMTLDMLRTFGADPQRDGRTFSVPPASLARDVYTVEPDLSTAAPFVAAALATSGRVRVSGWPQTTTQPGDWLRELATNLGGTAELDADGLTVTGPDGFSGRELDLHDVGELTPVVAALLCCADGPSTITGVAHLRGHETDRIAALTAELSGLGADVTELDDGLAIRPSTLHGGTFRTYSDHRLVMAAAVLALVVDGIVVDDPGTVGKTFPGFVDAWTAMLTGTG